jgi:hypothetical protein
MFKQLAFLRQDKYFFYIFIAGIGANIFSWILIFLFLKKETLNIILHYNILSGVDYQGSSQKLFIIPAIGLLVIFMNLIISRAVYAEDKFISYLLISAALVSQMFVVIAVITIILVNSAA